MGKLVFNCGTAYTELTPVNGYGIQKVYEYDMETMKLYKSTLTYWVCDGEDVVNVFRTLREAQKYAKSRNHALPYFIP